jgi:hypothetical protein
MIDCFDASSVIDGPMSSAKADFFWSQSETFWAYYRPHRNGPQVAGLPDLLSRLHSRLIRCYRIIYGLAEVQQAAARGVRTVVSSSWSAPASMKSNGVYNRGRKFRRECGNYTVFAAVFVADARTHNASVMSSTRRKLTPARSPLALLPLSFPT